IAMNRPDGVELAVRRRQQRVEDAQAQVLFGHGPVLPSTEWNKKKPVQVAQAVLRALPLSYPGVQEPGVGFEPTTTTSVRFVRSSHWVRACSLVAPSESKGPLLAPRANY